MKFPITPNTYTEKELKQAYSITVPDLFQKLVKAKTNQTIQIGSLGSLGSLKNSVFEFFARGSRPFHARAYA